MPLWTVVVLAAFVLGGIDGALIGYPLGTGSLTMADTPIGGAHGTADVHPTGQPDRPD